ncbi:MAG: GntR family transcriptional regulator [Pseudothermotoga sp.]|nr:GntR family transcriptional regulator [Pseudothermotoga sp.]MDW8140527.1 GntR family transcriptional regulator [Pseudothermotoga sp.]
MEKKKAWERAYNYVKTLILTMELKPGELVSEYSIANKLSMSRAPVREALKKLEQEGLLVSSANGRRRVFILTIRDIEQIFDLKEILESAIVEWAIERGTEDEKEELYQTAQRMLSLFSEKNLAQLDRESILKKWLQLDFQFHELIYRMSRNPRAANFVKNLNDQWQRLRQALLVLEGRLEKSSHEHAEIASAIVKNDKQAAVTAMKSHLLSIRKTLISVLKAFNFPQY